MLTSRRVAALAGAVLAGLAGMHPAFGQTSGTWAVDLDGSWSMPANWLGAVPDNGGTATFATLPVFTTAPRNIIQDQPGVTLSGVVFDTLITYALTRPAGNTTNIITLSGPAEIRQNVYNPVSWGTTTNGHFISIPIAGSAGLVKTGPGTISQTVASTYTGGTTINGGIIRTTVGDAAFGDSAGSITLNGGAIRTGSAAFNSPRTFNLAGAGTIETTVSGTGTISGALSGSGTFNKSGSSKLEFTGDSTGFTGAFNVWAGSVVFSGNGRLGNSGPIWAIGTVTLDNTATNNADRISDTAGITFAGGGLTVKGSASAATSEMLGNATFSSGVNVLSVEPGSGQSASVSFERRIRNSSGVTFFRGPSLGAAPGANVANVYFGTVPELVGGDGTIATQQPIFPWAYGGTAAGNSPSAGTNSLVTYGANGVRPLDLASEYATTITPGTTTLDNVRLTAAQAVGSATMVNAVVLASGSSLSGSGTLSLNSGVLLNLAANTTVACPIDAPSGQVIIHAPAHITLSGPISGSADLLKTGDGAATFGSSASTYVGDTRLAGGTISYLADVPASGPGPFGDSGGQILIAPGGFTSCKLQYAGTNSSATFSRPIVCRANNPLGNTALLPMFGVSGSQSLTMKGDITLNFPLAIRGGSAGATITLAGNIAGSGFLTDNGSPTVIITGNNMSSGGVEMNGGSYAVGSDTAFGSGPVKMVALSSPPTIYAWGGPRTVTNDTVSLSFGTTYWKIAGDQDITFSGSINLSGSYQHNITNTALTTYSGVLHTGGFKKTGTGTLLLSGNNIYTGTTQIDAGALRISNPGALGTPQGPTIVSAAGAALELSAGALTGEPVSISGSGIDSGGAIRSISGATSLGTVTLSADSAIAVDGGTLTTASVVTPAVSPKPMLTKSGAGTLRTDRLDVGTVNIAAGAIAIAPGRSTDKTSIITAISIAQGSLDMGDNDLVLDYGAGDPHAPGSMRPLLSQGFDGGAWDGSAGIRSSVAAANPIYGLGYGESADLLGPGGGTFSGVAVDDTAELLRYTYFGDTNLDGQVDVIDLGHLATAWQTSGLWKDGESNYDGYIDVIDLGMLATNWQAGVGAVGNAHPTAGLAEALASYGLPSVGVPEPAASVGAVVGVSMMMVRRRRPGRRR